MSAISDLTSLLSQTRTQDRHRFQRRLGNLRREGGADAQTIEALKAQIDASIQKVEARREANRIPIIYPDLPVSGRKDEIIEALQNNQVVIIAGETGSGKTTQLPKICLDAGLGCKGLIGHTQPRRLAARSVAARIAEEMHCELGARVGYQVRFHDQVSEQSQIKLMTDGILLAETQTDRFFEKYEVLIIDEAHERSLNIDFLLGYIKRILPKRPDLKLIITSATIDVARFSEHFGKAPIIEVEGRTYPVETLYRPAESGEESEQPYAILEALEEIIDIDKRKQDGQANDVLVFLSGEREIRETANILRKAELSGVEVLPLYARLSVAEQNKIFARSGRGRRVVLSTNVAETSLTVPGIRYVIDPGFARISRYSYRSKVQRLPIERISQASANQRKGRCGRVAPGVCVRLYSEEDFEARPEFTDAEIRRTNLAAVILQMLHLGLGDIALFPFIDPPDTRYVNDGFTLLAELGAVDKKRKLSGLGKRLSKLPVDPKLGRMLLEAERENCLSEVLVIASALSIQDPRERPHEKKQAADEKHRVYADKDSDFVTLVNLWNLYEEERQTLSQGQLRKYCQKHFLNFMRMREWRDVHRQLHLVCKQQGMKLSETVADYGQLHRALLSGLLGNMGLKQENKEFLGARNRKFRVFPGSPLGKKPPKWIMAAEVVETSQLFARTVAKIDPLWAEKLAPHLVKRQYLQPHWEKKRAQVIADEQVTLYGLIIIPKRKIHYGRIDPDVSHDLFIREGLVAGEFITKAPFFNHNNALREELESLEAKSRRRDLIVDDESIYQFYREKFAENEGAHIVNGQGFEAWRKALEQSQPKALFMVEEDLLQRDYDHVAEAAFPNHIDTGGVKLALDYLFEPGKEADGITLKLPVPLLNHVDQQRLEWLVPGMLREKCTAIMKGLPKQVRKNFVPIPDYVEKAVSAMVFGEGDLYEALALQLKRIKGQPLDPQLLRDVTLPEHLQFNIDVLAGDEGELATRSRDIKRLQVDYADEVTASLEASKSDDWGQTGLTEWTFSELPESVMVKQAGGIKVEAYPALIDQKTSVDLGIRSYLLEAQEESVQGIIRLAWLSLTEVIRFTRKQLPNIDRSAILSGGKFNTRSLQDQCIRQAIRQLMLLDDDLPRSAQRYKERLEHCRGELCAQAVKVSKQVFELHTHYHAIQKQLKGKLDLREAVILNDIKQQLSDLMPESYIESYSQQRLQDVVRYLKGITVRLEKFRRNLNQERFHSEQLQAFRNDWLAREKQLAQQGIYDAELTNFRWMLEEYRVSLFAQQLGTQITVSEKRMKQQWKKVKSV